MGSWWGVTLTIPDEMYGVMQGSQDPLPGPLYTGELLQGAVTLSYHQGKSWCHYFYL